MASTFKVVTRAAVTELDTIYTVADSTTTVVLGLVLVNATAVPVTSTVTLSSDTLDRAGQNDEANEDVEIMFDSPIPARSSLSVLESKIVMESTDALKVSASGATNIILSLMEHT